MTEKEETIARVPVTFTAKKDCPLCEGRGMRTLRMPLPGEGSAMIGGRAPRTRKGKELCLCVTSVPGERKQMDLERLDTAAIRERWEHVTPGPWVHKHCEGDVIHGTIIANLGDYAVASQEPYGGREEDLRNATAIAHAPQDILDLLAEVERLRNYLRKL